MKNKFYKKNKGDKVFWLDNPDIIGEWVFTFDKIKVYNMFSDYPEKLTKEEKEIFDKENPYWRDFFSDRKHN
ncbi:MAG: hypothetical protein PHI94_01200 [Eubacteriaceae bacterium]|nr:hypothetical protein [Eubacteriaceae bacterium]